VGGAETVSQYVACFRDKNNVFRATPSADAMLRRCVPLKFVDRPAALSFVDANDPLFSHPL
jgi:hypothetical protein